MSCSPQNATLTPSTEFEDTHRMLKKRKIDRACDSCRRKKTKCDGPKMPDSICTNCSQAHKTCTYLESSRPRGPSKAYITGMEDRLERLEALLVKLRPDTDFSEELGPPIIRDSWKSIEDRRSSVTSRNGSSCLGSEYSSTLQAYPVDNSSLFTHPRVPPPFLHKNPRRKSVRVSDDDGDTSTSSISDSSSDGGSSTDDECDRLQSLVRYSSQATDSSISSAAAVRYHGKSSQSSLVKVTRQLKELRLLEITANKDPPWRPLFRPEFWSAPPWELVWEGLHTTLPSPIPTLIAEFPPPDLARKLCDIYFAQINSFWPLLHRPTFDRQFNDRLHHRDHWFACLCLSVFAVASQWSSDLRVIPEQTRSGEIDWRQAGTRFLELAIGVHRSHRSLVNITCLFEVQTLTLLAMCCRARGSQHLAWLFVGVGIRKAMDIGVHRKRTYPTKPSVEGELWKRAFWLLVAFERTDSVALGRSCIIHDEDIDADLPLEVDDEYWETLDPSVAFRQPKGKPAAATAFNLWLQGTQIIAYTIRTLYAVNKSKSSFGVATGRRREEVMGHLSTALANWVAAVPEHLRWSLNIKDPTFSSQSAIIHASHHVTRILVHRTSVPSLQTEGSELLNLGDVSYDDDMSICVNSARVLAEIINHQLEHDKHKVYLMAEAAHFGAALVIRYVWWLKAREHVQQEELQDIKPPLAQTIDEMMGHIAIFTRALKVVAPRLEIAAQALRKIQESLPGYRINAPPARWSELLQPSPSGCRETAVSDPTSEGPNVWQWFATAEIPPKSPQYYASAADHDADDITHSDWETQEPICPPLANGQLRTQPSISPRISWQTARQSCATACQQDFSQNWQRHPPFRGISRPGPESTKDRLDARPRNGLFSEVTHTGRRQAFHHLPPLPHSDSQHKAGRQRKGIKSADRSID